MINSEHEYKIKWSFAIIEICFIEENEMLAQICFMLSKKAKVNFSVIFEMWIWLDKQNNLLVIIKYTNL